MVNEKKTDDFIPLICEATVFATLCSFMFPTNGVPIKERVLSFHKRPVGSRHLLKEEAKKF